MTNVILQKIQKQFSVHGNLFATGKTLFLLLLLMVTTVAAKAQTQTLTVNQGEIKSAVMPVNGGTVDQTIHTQFVIPGTSLTTMKGMSVTNMSFAIDTPADSAWTGAEFKVYLNNVDYDKVDLYSNENKGQLVYMGDLDATGSALLVNFDTEYGYNYDENGASNLLVTFETYRTTGAIADTLVEDFTAIFKGVDKRNAGVTYDTYNTQQTVRNFLPQTTFTYYEVELFPITATINPVGAGHVNGTGYYRQGAMCTLSAQSAITSLSTFTNWTLNGTVVSEEPTIEFEVTGEANYVANFEVPEEFTFTAYPEYTTSNSCVPFYGSYVNNYYQRSQYIIPAEEIELLTGRTIGQMTLYSAYATRNWGNAQFKVYLKEVEQDEIADFVELTDADRVYSGTLSVSNYQLIINFNTAFTYNGGNLLVGFDQVEKGSSHYDDFYGVTVEGASAYGYNYNSFDDITVNEYSGKNFVPTTTFAVGNYENFTITANVNDTLAGTVYGAGPYLTGQNCTLYAIPYEKYGFVQWNDAAGDSLTSDNPMSFEVEGDATFTAVFQQTEVDIELTVNDEEYGTVDGAGRYNIGDEVTLFAEPAYRCYFINWTAGEGEEAIVLSTDAEYTFTATEDMEIFAMFGNNVYGAGMVTAYVGNDYKAPAPIWTGRMNLYEKVQYIIPAEMLEDMENKNVLDIKYTLSYSSNVWTTSNDVNVYFKEIDTTVFVPNDENLYTFEELTVENLVYKGRLVYASNKTMTVTLDEPYHYNGGNLLICFESTGIESNPLGTWYNTQNLDVTRVIYGESYEENVEIEPSESRQYAPVTTFSYYESMNPIVTVTPASYDMGLAPNGAWLETDDDYVVTIHNEGETVDVTEITTTNPYFSVDLGENVLPVTLKMYQEFEVNVLRGVGNGEETGDLVVTCSDGNTFEVALTAEAYNPLDGDVWEKAITVTLDENNEYTNTIQPVDGLYADYNLPVPNNEEENNFDVVYKMELSQSMMLTAGNNGDNGRTFVYAEGFNGKGGPSYNNFYEYNGPVVVNNRDNNTYIDANFNDSLMPMGWYYDGFNPWTFDNGYAYCNHADQTSQQLMGTSYLYTTSFPLNIATDATLAFEYKNPKWDADIDGFTAEYWNGHEWDTLVATTAAHTDWMSFSTNISETIINHMRGDIVDIFVLELVAEYPEITEEQIADSIAAMSEEIDAMLALELEIIDYTIEGFQIRFAMIDHFGYGVSVDNVSLIGIRQPAYQIADLYVPAGTYYIVSASDDVDFQQFNIHLDTIPSPEPTTVDYGYYYTFIEDEEEPITNYIYPLADATNVPVNFFMHIALGYYTEEMQVLVDNENTTPETVIIDWTTSLVDAIELTELAYNRTYYVQVNTRNYVGEIQSEIIHFTTELEPVHDFTADATELYVGDTVTFTWTAIDNALGYNVYRDGYRLNETTITETTYTVTGLAYNMPLGSDYTARVVFKYGESNDSNIQTVYVTGNGTFNGHIYELDGVTAIAGATVAVEGIDEFLNPVAFTLTTNENGAFEQVTLAGLYDVTVTKDGYQEFTAEGIEVEYNAPTNLAYTLTEVYVAPTNVVATLEEFEEEEYAHLTWEFEGYNAPEHPTFYTFVESEDDLVAGDQILIVNTSDIYSLLAAGKQETNNRKAVEIGFGGFDDELGFTALTPEVADQASSQTKPFMFTLGGEVDAWTFQDAVTGGYLCAPGTGNHLKLATTLSDKAKWSIEFFEDGSAEPVANDTTVAQNIMRFNETYFSCYAATSSVNDRVYFIKVNNTPNNRSVQAFNIYRTANETVEPYTFDNTDLIAQNVTYLDYNDLEWNNIEPGYYKYGVSAIYEGNRGYIPYVMEDFTIDFETGDLSQYDFNNDETYAWTVVNDDYTDTYAMKSGNAGVASSTSAISMAVNYEYDGTFSFDGRVLGEGTGYHYYDVGAFYIDGQLIFRLGRQNTEWVHYSVDITAGEHIFRWTYTKDHSVDEDGDAFYVDNIRIYETVETVQWDNESPIVWSNMVEKSMALDTVSIEVRYYNAFLGNQPAEGAVVTLTNAVETEPSFNGVVNANGVVAWPVFRYGDYTLTIEYDGYNTITEEMPIHQAGLIGSYVMYENVAPVNPIVSNTGWARWNVVDRGVLFYDWKVLGEEDDLIVTGSNVYGTEVQIPTYALEDSLTYAFYVRARYSNDETGYYGWSDYAVTEFMYVPCDEFEGGVLRTTRLLTGDDRTGGDYYTYELNWTYDNAEAIGAQVFRDENLIGFTTENTYVDTLAYTSDQYSIRVVYADYNMSCTIYPTYTVAVAADPVDAGTVKAGYWEYDEEAETDIFVEQYDFELGDHVWIIAEAGEDYEFMYWTCEEGDAWFNAATDFYMNENSAETYTANFRRATDPHFVVVNPEQYASTMLITGVIAFDGEEQQNSAFEIGAFVGDEVRGSAFVNYYPQVDRYLAFLTVYGGNDTVAEEMNFRLYNHQDNIQYAKICDQDVTFEANGMLGTPVNPYWFNFIDFGQVSVFYPGWNWWSTYLVQDADDEYTGIDGLTMLEEGLGEDGLMIKSQFAYVSNYEGEWDGSLEHLNNEGMFMVNVTDTVGVEMMGVTAVAAERPITLMPGWNYIGFVSAYAMPINYALDSVHPVDGDMIKTQMGYSIYFAPTEEYEGGWDGSLEFIYPGDGLLYKSNSDESMTFVYPDPFARGEVSGNKLFGEHWNNNVHAYQNNMTIMAVVELDDEELRADGYELGVFSYGEARGSVKMNYVRAIDRYVAFLTVSGDEAEDLYFGLYNANEDVENFDCNNALVFSANAMVGNATEPYVISFRGTNGGNELGNGMRIYPNPAERGQRMMVEFATDNAMPVIVEIVNTLGQVISAETSTSMPASIAVPETAGVYTVRIITDGNNVNCRKLIVR